MHSSSSTYHQKFSNTTASAPPDSAMPTGIQVSSTEVFYSCEMAAPRQPQVPWSTGLCGCFSDVHNCCKTFWCPCITFGQIAEIVDQGSSSCGMSGVLYTLIASVTGLPCIYTCFYRTKMRKQYSLQESPCADFLVHCCCQHCALCQEYRELKNRGFDMIIGWHGNVERQNRGIAMPPIVQGGMTR